MSFVKPSIDNQYITNCKVCGSGVFTHQSRIWLRQPMGISHMACVSKPVTTR